MSDRRLTIALVAHDNMKVDLAEWVDENMNTLAAHDLVCTGTTGKMVEHRLSAHSGINSNKLSIRKLKSGPLGGDQQLGALITDCGVDMMVFFWDPMQAQPHDVDVKALLRLATLYNVPTAVNRSSADFLISSPLFGSDYRTVMKDYSSYINRALDVAEFK